METIYLAWRKNSLSVSKLKDVMKSVEEKLGKSILTSLKLHLV